MATQVVESTKNQQNDDTQSEDTQVTDTQITTTNKDRVDPKRKLEAQMWMQTVLGLELDGDLFDELQDGTILCELVNKIKPGTCSKFKKTKSAWSARNNISIFIKGARQLGVPETDIFETNDLYDKQRLSAVVQSIYALSAISRKFGFQGPFIGVAYSDANKRYFTKEQLAKCKSAIPMINRGGRQLSVDWKQDLIIKTKVHQHSRVQRQNARQRSNAVYDRALFL